MAEKIKDAAYEIVGDCMFFRPTGEVTREQVTELAVEAITYAREQKIPNLVINTTRLSGYPPPTITQRYAAVERCAPVAMGAVKIALVTRPERMDVFRFQESAGFNRGLITDVFLTEAEALAWLASLEKESHGQQ